jgi:CBS domain-containing protein
MTAGTACNRVVVTAVPTETVRTGARRMAERDVGTLVVLVDNGTRAAGIVTDRDIALRSVAAGLDPERTPLATIMTHPVRTVDEGIPIEEAVQEMARGATRRLVVTGAGNVIVGILSMDDVLDLLIGEFSSLGRLIERQGGGVPTY